MSKKKRTEYEELRDVWYAKLKDETDFVDIEWGDDIVSKGRTPRGENFLNAELREATEDYYRIAYHFLHEYEFEANLDKVIWEYHAEGISVRDIVITLNKTLTKKTDRNKVWRTLNKLDAIMKKKYLNT